MLITPIISKSEYLRSYTCLLLVETARIKLTTKISQAYIFTDWKLVDIQQVHEILANHLRSICIMNSQVTRASLHDLKLHSEARCATTNTISGTILSCFYKIRWQKGILWSIREHSVGPLKMPTGSNSIQNTLTATANSPVEMSAFVIPTSLCIIIGNLHNIYLVTRLQ